MITILYHIPDQFLLLRDHFPGEIVLQFQLDLRHAALVCLIRLVVAVAIQETAFP